MAGYYDYNDLKEKAINGDQNAVNELGEWFSNYGERYWNGEYYDADGLRVYPVHNELDEDEYELTGYAKGVIL